LGALGFLIGGAASVAKAVNDSKVKRQLEELQRHDRAMEQGRGLYLAPYKYGRGLYLGPYKHEQSVAAKKKKHRKDDKNAVWRNYQCAIERARETYARTLEAFSCVTRYRRAARTKQKRYRESVQCDGAWYSLSSVHEEKQPRRVL